MKIEKFQDVVAWQKARELAKHIYELTNKGSLARDYPFRDQMRRASLSPTSNIAEGFARQTDKEFIQFLYIALGSIAELESLTYLAKDLQYVSETECAEMLARADEVARLITGFVKYLKTQSSR